jgi:phosphatidate phosphatase APP1
MNRCLFLISLLFATQSIFPSPLDDDDELLIYPTFLYLDSNSQEYKLKIHIHAFEKKEESLKRKFLIEYFKTQIDEIPSHSETLKERMKWFLIDNKRGKEVSVDILGKIYPLKETQPNGRSITEIVIPKSSISLFDHSANFVEIKTLPSKKNKKTYYGKFFLIPESTTCLVSDIDDTLKISDVRNKKALMKNSFVNPFLLVKGMKDFYQKIYTSGNSCFVNVSASPWQLYSVLSNFFDENGFPQTGYFMKDFRLKDSDFFNLFEKPEEYKYETIEPLIKEWKNTKFILVGDSGEKDPEAYARLAVKYPDQISKIYIRIAYDENLDQRIKSVFEKIPKEKYQFFENADELK